VRRVFIMDDAEQLLPAYLRFVRGVVDSNDLPLNVSREILQESKDIEAIRGGCTRKVLALLEDLAANDKEKYAKFWDAFGKVLKEGAGEDAPTGTASRPAALRVDARGHRRSDRVARRLHRPDEGGTGQDLLRDRGFVQCGANSPHLEVFRKKASRCCSVRPRR
jgi:molecular chaperone HtpG